ncbi:type 1 fimbrial protein [Acinetobacter vivianii]|uniref:type 1 fimbrial protein n=1 Tax=Acinetobacter vivianii TaxID=1776742 RepID=UPI0019084647|nr:type 1 fimbrial protein [Acinetobacter vivianii]MBJ8481685.1 type 1 fimbrial protein [Acinetobacter vivianii]
MYKNIYKSALVLSLMAFSSVSYATGTIQISGKIVEDTCFQQHYNIDCQPLNTLRNNAEVQTSSLNDLTNQMQENDLTSISIEQLPEQNSAVVIASYY